MEPDTFPIRKLWLEALYEEAAFSGSDFYIKGSIYRGPAEPLAYCYELCGCAEHMNGNAIYKLGDDHLNVFLRSVFRKMDFKSYNYDAFIMNQLKSEENWRFWQSNAHKFQYTEFIQQGQHGEYSN